MRRPRGDDAGFTLMELLMAMVIMGIITLPLGNFVLAYFDNYQTTENRLSDSHDIQIATAYFSADVANTGLRSTTSPYTPQQSIWTTPPPAPYCGSTLSGTTVLLLKGDSWTVSSGASPTGTDAPISVAYVVSGGTLKRVYCPTGSSPTTTTVVHNLVSATASCFASISATTPTSCDVASAPPKVRLTLNISGGTQDAAAPPQPVTLDGLRRQS